MVVVSMVDGGGVDGGDDSDNVALSHIRLFCGASALPGEFSGRQQTQVSVVEL